MVTGDGMEYRVTCHAGILRRFWLFLFKKLVFILCV